MFLVYSIYVSNICCDEWYLSNVNIDIIRSFRNPFLCTFNILFDWNDQAVVEKFWSLFDLSSLLPYNTLTRSYLGEHEVLMQHTRKGLSQNDKTRTMVTNLWSYKVQNIRNRDLYEYMNEKTWDRDYEILWLLILRICSL